MANAGSVAGLLGAPDTREEESRAKIRYALLNISKTKRDPYMEGKMTISNTMQKSFFIIRE